MGEASAVLLRGGRPLVGEQEMRRRRGRVDHLCDGPGRLAQALGVTGDLDGIDLLEGVVRLMDPPVREAKVTAGPRVGISRAIDRPWRFRLAESEERHGPAGGPAGVR